MKITFLCTDENHPINSYLIEWMKRFDSDHSVELVRCIDEAFGGDFLFLISCTQLIRKDKRSRYKFCLVLHASELPNGRGWSPHIWELANGADFITLSLIEADDLVDCGRIWLQERIPIAKDALWYEINDILFKAELRFIDFAVKNYEKIAPTVQPKDCASYYSRRTCENSRLDPNMTIAEQFDLLRVCDPDRYPAFIELHGAKYLVKLEKIK